MSRRREREKERENETKKLDFDKNDFILEYVCREKRDEGEREKGREETKKERETVRGKEGRRGQARRKSQGVILRHSPRSRGKIVMQDKHLHKINCMTQR